MCYSMSGALATYSTEKLTDIEMPTVRHIRTRRAIAKSQGLLLRLSNWLYGRFLDSRAFDFVLHSRCEFSMERPNRSVSVSNGVTDSEDAVISKPHQPDADERWETADELIRKRLRCTTSPPRRGMPFHMGALKRWIT